MSEEIFNCEHCGRELDATKVKWIEMSAVTGKYVFEEIPESESQGWFSVGATCYKTLKGEQS